MERLIPADVLARQIPPAEQIRHRLLSRYRAHGLLGMTGGTGIFIGLGPARADRGLPGRTALRDELIHRGELVPVAVEGVRGTRLVLSAEVETLTAPPEPGPSVDFLSPSIHSSGTEPCWRACSPSTTSGSCSSRLRSGAGAGTSSPIVFRDRFVGRPQPRINDGDDRVDILDVWWEDGFTPAKAEGFVDAMRDALTAYRTFAEGASPDPRLCAAFYGRTRTTRTLRSVR